MTFGPGRRVWERFGHNAIWVHDAVHGSDLAYNYGLFDFHQQNFLLRFIRGQMWYWMDGFPAEPYTRLYRRENRSVWIQELDLPPATRRELQAFLEWNALPEHRYYHYDYYRDNCSTRVRDALDRVLGGRIRAQTASVWTGATYRYHTQRLTTSEPLIYTGLLAALGPAVDRPISAWEEMFLPMKLREHLRRVMINRPDGRMVPLVKAERTLYESSTPLPPDAPPPWLPRYLAVGSAWGVAAIGLAALGRRRRSARAAFAVLASAWALLAGTAGLTLAGLWAFTDHVMAYHNENLLQVNPIALPLVLLVPAMVRGARWAARPGLVLSFVVAGLSALGLVVKLLPAFVQVNGPIVALALPAHLGAGAGMWVLRRRASGGP
jgi:hypothetical protein